MKENEISREWLESKGFTETPAEVRKQWLGKVPKQYKVEFSLHLKVAGLTFFMEFESGGMWFGGCAFTEASMISFHESPPPSKYRFCRYVHGLSYENLGPSMDVEDCLDAHGVNVPMLRKVLKDAQNQYRSKAGSHDRGIDPAEDMYWDNIKKLQDLIK